jgi:hypothetical protein
LNQQQQAISGSIKKNISLLAALIISAAAVWKFGFSGSTDSLAELGMDQQTQSSIEQPSEQNEIDGGGALPQAQLEVKENNPGRTQAAPGNSSATLEPITFRVVDWESEEPIAGATVFFLQDHDIDKVEHEEMGLGRTDISAVFKRFGRSGQTDVNGELQMDWDGKEGGAFAEFESMQSEFESTTAVGGSLITLKLLAENGTWVQVIDLAGKPVVGAPVSLRVVLDDPAGQEPNALTLFRRETLPPDGKINFAGTSGLLSFDADPDPEYFARLEIPGIKEVKAALDYENNNSEVIILQLPEVGSMRIEVVDSEGRLLPHDGKVELRSIDLFSAQDAIRSIAELNSGGAQFEFVGLNCTLEAEVHVPKRGMKWQERVAAPTSAAGTAVVQLVAPTSLCVLGRLLLPDTKPAVRKQGLLTVQDHTGRYLKGLDFRTDGSGNFLCQIPDDFLGEKEYKLFVTCKGPLGTSSYHQVDTPVRFQGPDIDVGDLQLTAAYTLIRGRCIDTEGNPIPDLHLFAYRADGIRTGAFADKNGEFHFSSTFKKQTNIMLAQHPESPWVLPEPVLVEVDADPIDIVFFQAGSISGQLQIPAEFDDDRLQILAVPHTAAGNDDHSMSRGARVHFPTGTFEISSLNAGTYRLELRGRQAELITSMDNVEVSLGHTTTDPRLHPWRFMEQVHTATLLVVNEELQPISGKTAFLYRNGEKFSQTWARDKKLICRFDYPEQVEIMIHAHGYRPTIVAGTTRTSTVILQRGLQVTLECANPPKFKRGDEEIHLSLVWKPQDSILAGIHEIGIPTSFYEHGKCKIDLPGPGEYQIRTRKFTIGGSSYMSGRSKELDGTNTLIVHDGDYGRTIPIQLPSNLFN